MDKTCKKVTTFGKKMKAGSLYRDYEIREIGFPQGVLQEVHQQFFQVLYVRHGQADLSVNGFIQSLKANDIVLLKPGDVLSAKVQHEVSCYCIRFHRIYFTKSQQSLQPDYTELFYRFEYIVNSYRHSAILTLLNEDQLLAKTLFARLLTEEIKRPRREVFIQHCIIMILLLVAQNIQLLLRTTAIQKNANAIITDVMDYIHYHIFENEKIKVNALAQHFTTTREVLLRLFKKETGTGIKQYILNYKIQLACSRLMHSKMSVSEIAYELGFTDVSHFQKVFKNVTSLSVRSFREENVIKQK